MAAAVIVPAVEWLITAGIAFFGTKAATDIARNPQNYGLPNSNSGYNPGPNTMPWANSKPIEAGRKIGEAGGRLIAANEAANKAESKDGAKDQPIADTCSTCNPPCQRNIVISKGASPQAAQHILDAQAAGYPKTLTYSRLGVASRRRAATSGYPTVPGKDRDEYPFATSLEGGIGASVRLIDAKDNRSAGAQMMAQLYRPSPPTEGCKLTIGVGP